ncbi:MAG: NUDIX domain-containing protein [Gammaproteobacteria bacterium]|nr:NUDIX domain-containing protein [Gammaproteobacteria bacterium]
MCPTNAEKAGLAQRPPRILSCGAVVARRHKNDWLLLLLRAYQYWDFPKGRTEKDETPMQAAYREVAEETGITDLSLDWGEDYIETGPYARGKIARYYLASTQTKNVILGIAPELGVPEHHEWRWVTRAEAYRITAPRVQQVLDWAFTRLT